MLTQEEAKSMATVGLTVSLKGRVLITKTEGISRLTYAALSLYIDNKMSKEMQRLRKVFSPLDFSHILLRYHLILKCIQLFFPPHQSTHNTP